MLKYMEEILKVYPDFDFEYFHKIAKELYDLMNHQDFEKWLKRSYLLYFETP